MDRYPPPLPAVDRVIGHASGTDVAARRRCIGGRCHNQPMTPETLDGYPHQSVTRELAQVIAEGALSAIPLVGGPIAVGFAALAQRPLERRRAEWLTGLEAQISELATGFKGLNPEALASNEEFISALALGLRAAEATHENSVRSALANAVINSAMPGAPDADQQRIYLRFVGEFTPSHLRVLAFMDHPRAVLHAQGVPEPDWGETSTRKKILEWAVPDFEGRSSFVDQINRDLVAAGLTEASFDWANSGPGLYESLLTASGKDFLAYIATPSPCLDDINS